MKLNHFLIAALLVPVLTPAHAQETASIASATRPFLFGVNRVGDPPEFWDTDVYFEELYRRCQEAGGTAVRILASPLDIEPVRGQRDWKGFDRDLELAHKYGMEPMVLICNTPEWALPPGAAAEGAEFNRPGGTLYPYADEFFPDFTDFCRELAERTKGKATIFQLWNEQNGTSWHFKDGFNHADEYIPFLIACTKGIKAGNPDAKVYMGGLDDAEGNGHYFMEKTYAIRDKEYPGQRLFDGLTIHPYTTPGNPKYPDPVAEMKRKMDRMHKLMADNGDGDLPMWNTEYAWDLNEDAEPLKVKLLQDTFAMFQGEDMSYLKGCVMLCIADFSGTSFGLTDNALRPRSSFYAMQGVPRFGASPAHTITWKPSAKGSEEITFQTVLPTQAEVIYSKAGQSELLKAGETKAATEHRIELKDLSPDTDYEFSIITKTADGKTYKTCDYHFHSPGADVYNGGFESGFFAGVANGWRMTGDSIPVDGNRIPGLDVESGKHAQALYSSGKALKGLLYSWCAADAGKTVTLTANWTTASIDSSARVYGRAGIDPKGGADPKADSIVWTKWDQLPPIWDTVKIEAPAESTIATVYFEVKSDAGPGKTVMALDEVKASVH